MIFVRCTQWSLRRHKSITGNVFPVVPGIRLGPAGR
jgi:hypothetical protein